MKKTTILSTVFGVILLCVSAGHCVNSKITGTNQLVAVSSATYHNGSHSVAKSIDTDSAGDIFIVGSSPDNNNYLALKYYSLPNNSFNTATFSGNSSGNNSNGSGVVVDNNDDVIIVGQIVDGSKSNIFLRKYKNDISNLVSTITYVTSQNNYANAVVTDAQNNIYVTGYVNDGTKINIVTIKYNKDLTLLKTDIYQGGDQNKGNAIAVDSQGNVFVAGCSNVGGLWNFCVIKYNSSLIQQQVYRLNNGQDYIANAIAIDSKDNIIVTGQRYNTNTASNGYFTIKLDNAMNFITSASYDSDIAGVDDVATGVAIDSLNNIVVAGRTNDGSNDDYLTIKYDNNLNILSSDIYDGGSSNRANAVAIDIDDNIIVTGSCNNDYFTIKYNGTPSMDAISQAYQGETGDIALSGKCFDTGATISYTDSGISTNSINTSAAPSQIFSNITVGADVLLGLTTVTVTNANYEKSSRNDLLDIAYRKNVAFDVDTVITKLTRSGEITIDIPSYTYAQNESLILSASASTAPASGGARSAGVGMNATITPSVIGANDITITIKYNDAFATGLDKSKFVIAYYDNATLAWVAMPSSSYPSENKVMAKTKTLNRKFIVLQAGQSVVTLTGTRVYPNPYKPNSSGEYGMSTYGDGVVFANIVKNFKIKIFNVAGELIYSKDAVSDASYNYFWDTKCDSGEKAASGVYIFIIEDINDSTNKTKGKFSIIR